MRIGEYYVGRRVTLLSPLMPDQIKRCVEQDAKVQWWWRPFHVGPVGKVRWNRLKLRFASSPFEYNAKPLLLGSIERTATGTLLRLVYRGSTWARLFFVIWYVALALLAIAILTTGIAQSGQPDQISPLLIFGFLAVGPIGMHLFGTRRSDDELALLIEFLDRVAQAKPSRE